MKGKLFIQSLAWKFFFSSNPPHIAFFPCNICMVWSKEGWSFSPASLENQLHSAVGNFHCELAISLLVALFQTCGIQPADQNVFSWLKKKSYAIKHKDFLLRCSAAHMYVVIFGNLFCHLIKELYFMFSEITLAVTCVDKPWLVQLLAECWSNWMCRKIPERAPDFMLWLDPGQLKIMHNTKHVSAFRDYVHNRFLSGKIALHRPNVLSLKDGPSSVSAVWTAAMEEHCFALHAVFPLDSPCKLIAKTIPSI